MAHLLLDNRKIVINRFDTAPPQGWQVPAGMEYRQGDGQVGQFWNGSAFVEYVPSAEEVDARREQQLVGDAVLVALRIAFDHENRIRALERYARAVNNTAANTAGVPTAAQAQAVTAEQFRNAVKNRLD